MVNKKIMKTLFEKYLVKRNRPNCFSCKQLYQLINKVVQCTCLLHLCQAQAILQLVAIITCIRKL